MNTEFGVPSFRDEYEWMSNMYRTKVYYSGLIFPSSEHAYMWAKIQYSDDPTQISHFEWLNLSPRETKNYCKKVKLPWYWPSIKGDIMKVICYSKFVNNDELVKKLLATGDAPIEEGNTWNDKYFGVVIDNDGNKVGKNVLGRILMEIREDFRNKELGR